MGYNIKILAEKEATPGLHHGGAVTLELEECIHFHLEDFRFVWTTDEFLKIADEFVKAKKKCEEVGSPESTSPMIQLAGYPLKGRRMHQDRMAVELTRDGTVHLHNKSLRVHMTQADFYEFADMCREALLSLNKVFCKEIDITSSDIIFPSVTEEYLLLLKEYKKGKFPFESPHSVSELYSEVKWYITHPKGKSTSEVDLQRPDGHLPEGFPGTVPWRLNCRYLFAIYESIKEWGYAKGPYYADYMPAYKYNNNKTYLKGAHRAACLKSLGYSKVNVVLTEPNTAWTKG